MLINSVLDAKMLFPIPPKIERRKDALRKNFIWQGKKEKRGHLVKWKTVTLSKKQGGMGIKNLRKQNQRYRNEEQSLRRIVMKDKYGEEGPSETKVISTTYGEMFGSQSKLSAKSSMTISTIEWAMAEHSFWGRQLVGTGPLKTRFPDLSQ